MSSAASPTHQVAMVFDLNKCLGCQTCTIACKTQWTRGSGMEAVRDVVSMQSNSFTVRDILNDCGSGEITSRLASTALFRLADAGEIEVVERGAGQRPTKYRRLVLSESEVEGMEPACVS